METHSSVVLENLIVAGSGIAVGVFAILVVASVVAAVRSRTWVQRIGHACLAAARLGGAVVITLIAEALFRAPGGVPVSGRAYVYTAALVAIGFGYLGALLTRTVPR